MAYNATQIERKNLSIDAEIPERDTRRGGILPKINSLIVAGGVLISCNYGYKWATAQWRAYENRLAVHAIDQAVQDIYATPDTKQSRENLIKLLAAERLQREQLEDRIAGALPGLQGSTAALQGAIRGD